MFAIPCGLDMWYYRLGCKKQTREASYPPRCGLVYLSGFHFSSRSKALYNDFAGNEKLSNAWVQNKFQSKSEFNWEGQQEQHYLDVEAFSVSFCGSHCCNEWLTTLLCSFSGTRAWQHSDVTCSRMVEVLTSWESSPSRKKTKHEASIGLGQHMEVACQALTMSCIYEQWNALGKSLFIYVRFNVPIGN